MIRFLVLFFKCCNYKKAGLKDLLQHLKKKRFYKQIFKKNLNILQKIFKYSSNILQKFFKYSSIILQMFLKLSVASQMILYFSFENLSKLCKNLQPENYHGFHWTTYNIIYLVYSAYIMSVYLSVLQIL